MSGVQRESGMYKVKGVSIQFSREDMFAVSSVSRQLVAAAGPSRPAAAAALNGAARRRHSCLSAAYRCVCSRTNLHTQGCMVQSIEGEEVACKQVATNTTATAGGATTGRQVVHRTLGATGSSLLPPQRRCEAHIGRPCTRLDDKAQLKSAHRSYKSRLRL